MKKYHINAVLLIAMLVVVFLNSSNASAESDASKNKLMIISLRELDFETLKSLKGDHSSGLLSLKSTHDSAENRMLSMAMGRTLSYDTNYFGGVYRDGDGLKIKSYDRIVEELNSNYAGFSKNIDPIGTVLHENGIKTSYIGSDVDSIILADKEGRYDYGVDEISYDAAWLSENIERCLENSDVLMISYDIGGSEKRLDTLKGMLRSGYDYIVFSPNVSENMQDGLNSSLSLLIASDGQSGILTSESTKREGLVSSLDLKPTILNKFSIEESTDVGRPVFSEGHSGSEEIADILKETLSRYINLNISKYLFHGIVITIQAVVVLTYFFRRSTYQRIKWIALVPVTAVFYSIALNFFSRNLYVYIFGILALSISSAVAVYRKKAKLEWLISATSLLTLAGIFFFRDIIYNSFIGYNNIVAAGRYYGFNNDIMGVVIATAVITSFFILKKKNGLSGKFVSLSYLMLMVMSFTGLFGSNFGGLLTSVFGLFLFSAFYYFDLKKDRNKALLGICLLMAVILGVYFLTEGSDNHISNFFSRIYELGLAEFLDMMKKKLGQLIFMILSPHWSITIILQALFVKKNKDLVLNRSYDHGNLIRLILFSSLVALLVNDTGTIAFVYMNIYSLALILSLEERGFCVDNKS